MSWYSSQCQTGSTPGSSRSQAALSAGALAAASSMPPAIGGAGTRPVVDAARRQRGACQQRRAPRQRHTPHAHRRVLELRLAGDRVDGGRDQRVDRAGAGEGAAPVHRHEDAARALPDRRRRAPTHCPWRLSRARVADRHAEPRSVVRMQLHERLRRCGRTGAATCRCASSCATGRARGRCSAPAGSRASAASTGSALAPATSGLAGPA